MSQLQIVQGLGVCAIGYYALKGIDSYCNPKTNFWFNCISRTLLTLITWFCLHLSLPSNSVINDPNTIQFSIYAVMPMLLSFYLILLRDSNQRMQQTFIGYMILFLWSMVPISRNRKKEKILPFSFANILTTFTMHTLPYCLMSYCFLILAKYFQIYLTHCLDNENVVSLVANNYFYFTYYTWIQTMFVLCNMAVINGVRALVSLFTLYRYQWIELNRYPLFATSIRELWSRRYNLLMRDILHETIFEPLIGYGFNKSIAALSAFIVSGLVHVYISYVAFGKGLLSTICFFSLHGIGACVESFVGVPPLKSMSVLERVIRNMIALLFFMFTLPWFIGLFITAYPLWGQVTAKTFDIPYLMVNENAGRIPMLQCFYPKQYF